MKFHNDWVIFISYTKLLIVFTLCLNTDFTLILLRQLAKFSINFTRLFIAIWSNLEKGKEQKKAKCCKQKSVKQKNCKRLYSCSNQKLVSTQTSSTFPERVRKVENSLYEHDF